VEDTVGTSEVAAAPVRSCHLVRVGGRLLQRQDLIVPAAVWIGTRVLFVMLTYFGVIFFRSGLHTPHPSFLHSLLPAWQNPYSHGGWDTQWYINIAQRGYAWSGPNGTKPTAFFPLFPLLIHGGIVLTNKSALLVSLTIANLSFLGALVYLWKLTSWEFNSARASRTVLYIATFPTALFFFAGYTESLFLFLTVASFFHMRRKQWILAGLFAGLAAGTRVTGVLLILPFLYEYARWHNFSVRRALSPELLGLALAPVGLLAFMWYLSRTVGDALAFSHGQAAWQKIFTLELWSGYVETARQLLVVQPTASFDEAHNLIEGSVAVGFLILTVLAARRLPAAYTLYTVGFWLVTLSSPAMAGGYPVPFISMSRYVLSLFPVFMYLGWLGRRAALHDAYLVGGVGLLSLFTVQFIQGGWII
jgi:hypothetical protein